MTNKLTAKLSDGREYEVVDIGDTPKLGFCYLSVAPIKREPREFIISMLGDRIISCEQKDSNMTYAKQHTIKVREVLE